MGTFSSIAAAALAVAGLVSAAPVDNQAAAIGAAQAADIAYRNKMAGTIGDTKSIAAACAGQSCQVANLSGSTGKMPTIKPNGGDDAGYKCIAKYSPETVKAATGAPPGAPSPVSGGFGTLALGFAGALDYISGAHIDTGTYTCNCKKNIVIYARGTTEIGVLGQVVGPFLVNNLAPAADWEVCGVNYNANLSGDYCLGLPGGMVARDMLKGAAAKCPDSRLFMSGYSEGGMVSHNAVAYSTDDIKKKVAGVIVFGDPFQGAPIKGYTGPIRTYCLAGDDVCTGNFVIGFTHLAYSAGTSVQQGAKDMKDIAAGKAVKSNRMIVPIVPRY